MRTLKGPGRPSICGLLRILSIASLTALLLVLTGERHSAPVRAGAATDVPRTGNLYVLSIGINAYPQGSNILRLHFAVADAQGVSEAFSTKEVGNVYKKVEVKTLLDSDATLAGIRSALEHLIEVCKPEDVVIFYFAGDGWPTEAGVDPNAHSAPRTASNFNFLVFDSSSKDPSLRSWASARNPFTAHELSLLLLSIQAQRQIVIIDSSDATAAFDSLSAALNSDSVFTLRNTGRRFALFGVEGMGLEDAALGHGLMTYTLLKAMQGGADPDHKGFITEADLEGYMMSHMNFMNVQTASQLTEQLISFSDLRGLCLSAADNAHNCNGSYGYDPGVKITDETRGQGPRKPSAAQEAADRGTDYALILAGDTYDHWPKLSNPIYDARTLREELIQNFGYANENIIFRENPTEKDIYDGLKEFLHRSFGKNDRLFIYVAGHGYMDDFGVGFLIVRDSLLPAEEPNHSPGLDLSRFRSMVFELPVPHILLVLDVCYGGSFKGHDSPPEYRVEHIDTPPSLDRLIANKMEHPSRFYIASGGLREAFDGQPGRHSPFARTFLKTLRDYGGPEHIIDMGKLDGAVYGLCPHPYTGTFGAQQEGGDFIFIPKPDAQPVSDPGLDAKVESPHCSF
jgi:hypothetical protein